LRTQRDENTSLVREVPKAFDFQLVGEEVVRGSRPMYSRDAPRPGYHAQGKYGKMFPTSQASLGRQAGFGVDQVDGEVIQPFSMELFLARVLRGSHITMEQARVDNGIWMPERVEVRAAAKIFFIKSLVVERVPDLLGYRLAQAGAH